MQYELCCINNTAEMHERQSGDLILAACMQEFSAELAKILTELLEGVSDEAHSLLAVLDLVNLAAEPCLCKFDNDSYCSMPCLLPFSTEAVVFESSRP